MPKNLLFNHTTNVLSCDDIPEATKVDACASGGFSYPKSPDLISSYFERYGGRIIFPKIKSSFINPKHLNGKQLFWIVATIDGKKYKSKELPVEFNIEKPTPNPSDNVVLANEIKTLADQIKAKANQIIANES